MPQSDHDPALVKQLKRHEGFRPHVYLCTAGKQTIGYGRNLEDNGLTEAEAAVLLVNDVNKAKRDLLKRVPVITEISPIRQNVLINMTVNMGITRLQGFKKMLNALWAGDFELAADEMLDSRWAQQVGDRAIELAQQMRSGVMQGD